MRIIVAILIYFVGSAFQVSSQHAHPTSTAYQWPKDSLVRKKLDQWQDLKFGMIIHWGIYAVPGMIESWALCSEDWIDRDSTVDYADFKKWYWGLARDFNPVSFNPDQWADAGKNAGMKYLVFTTKHHDGFSMFATRHSNFNISAGPFKDHPKSDVARHVFDAFRKRDFMIGAYFSKPDWHSEYYWWPKYATADRNNNYDIRKYPWRWNKFKEFTQAQIHELMTNYGSIDILWLDGGWVRPLETITDEVRSWGARIPEWSQDIDIPSIASAARQAQPGILVVDRTVHGEFENYQTPEQRVPANPLPFPWESCITLGNAWGYVPGDKFKSASQVIHSLVEIVAKGGSLLLGIGPKPDGTLPDEAVQRLNEIGKWMQLNGKSIYGTRPVTHYKDSTIFFTRGKASGDMFAIACLPSGADLPASIEWTKNLPRKKGTVTLLETGEKLRWTIENGKVKIAVPGSTRKKLHGSPAVVISFKAEADAAK